MNPYYNLALDPRTRQPRQYGIATEENPYLLQETDEQNAAADEEFFLKTRQELIDSLTTTGDITAYQRDQWRDLWGYNPDAVELATELDSKDPEAQLILRNFEDSQTRIRMLEHSLELDETGNLDRMIDNYRHHYYTPLCRGRMEARECWNGAIAHGDLHVVKEFWDAHQANQSVFPTKAVLEESVILAIETGEYPMVRLLNSMHNDFPAMMKLEIQAAVRANKPNTTLMLLAKTNLQHANLEDDAVATLFESVVHYDRKELLDHLWRSTPAGPNILTPNANLFIQSGGREIGRSGRMEWLEYIQSYANFAGADRDYLLAEVIMGAYEAGNLEGAPIESARSRVLQPIIVKAFADGNFEVAQFLLEQQMVRDDPDNKILFSETIVLAATTSPDILGWMATKLDFRAYSNVPSPYTWKGDNDVDMYRPYMNTSDPDVIEYRVYDNSGKHVGNSTMAPVLLAYRRNGRNPLVAEILDPYLHPHDKLRFRLALAKSRRRGN